MRTVMPGKPPLTVFVVHGGRLESIGQLDRARERDDRAHSAVERSRYGDWRRGGLSIEHEKHMLHLQVDVHPGHAGACALLVVHDASVDAMTRLAALHARRAGLHRFVLLVDDRYPHPAERVDAAERDARELLAALGVDGDAVPAVRAPLHDTVLYAEEQAAAMRELLAALDELPAELEPEPLRTTPPEFAAEAEILDALAPLYAPMTYIDVDRVDPEHTLALRSGSGGSHAKGVPYLERDEAWPNCPDCRRPLRSRFQFDVRDFQHPAPPGHGLFVVFDCRCDAHLIRHHPAPVAERRRSDDEVLRAADERPKILIPDGVGWSLPMWRRFPQEHPDVAARMHALVGHEDPERSAFCALQAVGGNYSRECEHFGGHFESEHSVVARPTPRCGRCGAACEVIAHVRWPDDVYYDRATLWACREHPDEAAFAVHS